MVVSTHRIPWMTWEELQNGNGTDVCSDEESGA
jgi:hypothetical protein